MDQIIIRALKSYIDLLQNCADVRDAEGNEEARRLFEEEATEARRALNAIESGCAGCFEDGMHESEFPCCGCIRKPRDDYYKPTR